MLTANFDIFSMEFSHKEWENFHDYFSLAPALDKDGILFKCGRRSGSDDPLEGLDGDFLDD